MKIVVLDGYTVSRDDVSWQGWDDLGELRVYERTRADEVVRRLTGVEIALTNKVVVSGDEMEQLPQLRYIGVLATGHNVVDLEAASSRGIVVTNIPAYSTMSVAQMVFAHLLNITNGVATHAASVRAGEWQRADDFCYCLTTLQELEGRTLAIVGLGNIGMAVARMARAFGMRVVAYSSKSAEALGREGMEKVETLEELFVRADVLSLHCPLTPDTRHMVNARRLALMKPTAIVINTGRGALVDEGALADALNTGRVGAAALDVLEQEPPVDGSPLIGARNCHITPHIAWATLEARKRLMATALDNVRAFMMGKPINQVNR